MCCHHFFSCSFTAKTLSQRRVASRLGTARVWSDVVSRKGSLCLLSVCDDDKYRTIHKCGSMVVDSKQFRLGESFLLVQRY